MAAIFRVFLKQVGGRVISSSRTVTSSKKVAKDAFAILVNRTDLDGSDTEAVLSYPSGRLARHWFQSEPGESDYWRGRVDEIVWPPGQVGRPSALSGGKRINVYLGEKDIAIATGLGAGNVSEGIRLALAGFAGTSVRRNTQ